MPKVKFTTNIGTIDQKRLGLGDNCQDGEVAEVSEKQRLLLVERGWATDVKAPPQAAETAASESPPEQEAEQSPLADDSAVEAIDKISRMRSTEKLEEILASDERVTVQEAALRRLEELQG